jgi:hypothetical protein
VGGTCEDGAGTGFVIVGVVVVVDGSVVVVRVVVSVGTGSVVVVDVVVRVYPPVP